MLWPNIGEEIKEKIDVGHSSNDKYNIVLC